MRTRQGYLEKHKEHQFVLASSGIFPSLKFLKKWNQEGRKIRSPLLVIKENKSESVKLGFNDAPTTTMSSRQSPNGWPLAKKTL